jgi:hypothetical protein
MPRDLIKSKPTLKFCFHTLLPCPFNYLAVLDFIEVAGEGVGVGDIDFGGGDCDNKPRRDLWMQDEAASWRPE